LGKNQLNNSFLQKVLPYSIPVCVNTLVSFRLGAFKNNPSSSFNAQLIRKAWLLVWPVY
jgi:hypothetical protein